MLTDADLARKQRLIHAWTSTRVGGAFRLLQRMPGARADADVETLARILDALFWDLLAQAARNGPDDVDLRRAVDATVYLVHHALFDDRLSPKRSARPKSGTKERK